MTRRRRYGWRASARGFCAALLLMAAAGCAASGPDGGPRDLLGHLADDGSLVDAAFSRETAERLVAVRALARLPADENSALVLERVRSERDPEIMDWLAFAAARWRLPSSEASLRVLAGHADGRVRAAGVEGLGRLADDALTDDLVAALSDPDAAVRRAAALALFRLDGRRFEHERVASESSLAARDVALTEAALTDPDPGVRWRAIYALAGVRGRASHGPVLGRALSDEDAPLARVFGLRGLAALTGDGLYDDVLAKARPLVDDADERVAIEAARVVAGHAPPGEVASLAASARSAHARRVALQVLRGRLDDGESMGGAARNALAPVASSDPSTSVRREARAVLGAAGDSAAFTALVGSAAPRDRVLAAELVGAGHMDDPATLAALLVDPSPVVAAAALAALGDPAESPEVLERLLAALTADDPAVRGTAAETLGPLVRSGRAPPRVVRALAEAVERTGGYEFDEARVSAAQALGLAGVDPSPPAEPTVLPLFDALLLEHQAAVADPAPKVKLATSRGEILLELHRVDAPRHVESFLELAAAGVYDGLDVHRVVPNFVVQGLDPRGDGWGVGGRRVPDEFSPRPFLSGTLGMPHAGSPHTGGCQIFLTHLPTPHLDGAYTVFGHVLEGLDVLAALQVDDVITSVTRVDEAPVRAGQG